MDDVSEQIIVMGDLNGRMGKTNRELEEYMDIEGETVQNGNGRSEGINN